MKKADLLKFFLAGFLVRLVFSFWTGNPHDFEIFIRVGYYVANGASPVLSKYPYIEGLGQPTCPYVSGLGYLPAWGLCLALVYRIYETFPFSPYFYYFLLKLFPVMGDLLTTCLIYLLIKRFASTKENAKQEKILSNFYLCPFVIFISSIWGMFDSIPIFFTLLSIFFMLSEKTIWSAFSLGLGIYFKPIPIIYLPIQLLLINRKSGIQKAIIYLLVVLTIPFFLTIMPILFYGWNISDTAVTLFSQTQRSGDLLTYWNLTSLLSDMFPNIFNPEVINSFFSFPPIRYFWVLGLIVSYFSFYEAQKELSESNQTENLNVILKGFLFVTISFLLTRTFIPEQYVLYLLSVMVFFTTNKLINRHYQLIWVLALVFALVNLYPFAFAYIVNIKYWDSFNYLAKTQPYSTIRYLVRFIIAMVFSYYLIKIALKMGFKSGKSFSGIER